MSVRFLISFLIILLAAENECERLKDLMYESFPSSRACYRRLNGTHQIGCSSDYGGSVGVVTLLRNESDVDWILNDARAPPYAVVMELSMLKRSVIEKLSKRPDRIAGLLIYQSPVTKPPFFSHESRCPNEMSQGGPEHTYCKSSDLEDVWNPVGTGFMLHNVPFSVFYLPPDKPEYLDSIMRCYDKFNSFDLEGQSDRSLCSVEMDAFMHAAMNSEVCIRRSNIMVNLRPTRYCDPLADKSLYFSLFSRSNFTYKTSDFHPQPKNDSEEILVKPGAETKGSVALVSVALDATSFIDGFGTGAVSTISAMSVLMATAHTLLKMFPQEGINSYSKNVIFMIFNGESYDYIGSQRFAWDLIHGYFPTEGPILKPDSIGLHIHIGQMHGKSPKLNLFTPDYEDASRNEKVDKFAESLKISKEAIIRGKKIPPSSVHTFLRLLNSSVTQMASAVLADHGESFDNAYYQSLLDDKENLGYNYLNLSSEIILNPDVPGGDPIFPDNQIPSDSIQSKLADISTKLSLSLYNFVTGSDYNKNISASSYIIDEILHCYLESSGCELLSVTRKKGSPVVPLDSPPPSLYIGVSGYFSPASLITYRLASYLTSTTVNRTKENCKAKDDETVMYQFVTGWDEKGVCVRSFINNTIAMSPAFLEEGYDFASGKYSTWTESVWQSISLRMLVQPPASQKNMTLGVGILTFVLSTLIIIGIRKHVVNLLYEEDDESVSRVDC